MCYVEDGETLGRRVSSRKRARKAQRKLNPRISHREFMPRQGERELSLDRLSIVPLKTAVAIADRAAQNTPSGKFCGWITVSAKIARINGIQVIASPLDDNPYHADIVFPSSDKDECLKHAQELALKADWQDRS